MRIVRWIGRGLAALVLLAVLAGAAAWIYLRQSLPQLDGTASVKGPGAAIDIVRDAEGVPHVFAKSERDGWFAVGYLHAQDRLWQMEVQRRLGAGRIAEVFGERAYDTDRLMRVLGIQRTAERIVERIDAGTRADLEAYAAGVNAFLAADPVLPVEFQAFRVKPAPWKPADTVAWLLVMSWDLSANYRSELTRLRFTRALGAERTAELLPGDTSLGLAALPDLKALYAEIEPFVGPLIAQSAPFESALGSNSWVAGGARTASGKPLLANDPHLGLQTPALWYFVHIATPERNLVGGTLPGSPCIVLGRNDHVAWTLTTTNSDTQDLFVERVAPDDASSYLTPTGREKFRVREEVIRVDGEDRRITVRETRHGPVISDVVKPAAQAIPSGHVLALAWAALTDDNATVRAGFGLNRAKSRDEFVAAARDFHSPHQDIVLADRDGRFSFISPARVPVRSAGNEIAGRAPVPGWIAKYDWQGFLPFEELPAMHDPATGTIVTANSRVSAPGYRRWLSAETIPPYRVERIEELLAAQPKHTRETFARMQADTRSRLVRELLPIALAAHPEKEEGRAAQALLREWKGDMSADSPAPLVFAAWYRELTRLVYADEFGDLFNEAWDMRAPFMISVLKGGFERWCDDVRTPAKEDCGLQTARAFDFAAADLEKRYGERSKWRWGAAHVAAADHRPFGFVPVISRLFNVSPETAGDAYSVNVGHFFIRDATRPFASRHGPSLRAIYDLADLDRSLFMHSTGQSGNFLSSWYGNYAERWAKVEYIEIPTRRESIAGAHTLRLLPQ